LLQKTPNTDLLQATRSSFGLISFCLIVSFLAGFSMASAAAVEDAWIVHEDGVGPVKIGMKLPALNAALGEKFAMPQSKNEQSCFYLTPKKQPGVAFMMIDGKLARIDVRESGVRTTTGIQVGDSQARALQIYGDKLNVEKHKYLDEGHYLTVKSSDGHYGIRFESDGKKITMYYAGRFDAIQLVEGCQ
jgi:hypothetical protein